MQTTNNLENLANVLANLGVQTFNPQTNEGAKVNVRSGISYQLTDEQTKNSEEYETEYRDGIVKSVSETLQYNDATGTVKQKVIVTVKTPSGKDVDFEATRTLKNSVGSTKTPVTVGQAVTLLVSKHKTDKTKKVRFECIDRSSAVNVGDYEELMKEPSKK